MYPVVTGRSHGDRGAEEGHVRQCGGDSVPVAVQLGGHRALPAFTGLLARMRRPDFCRGIVPSSLPPHGWTRRRGPAERGARHCSCGLPAADAIVETFVVNAKRLQMSGYLDKPRQQVFDYSLGGIRDFMPAIHRSEHSSSGSHQRFIGPGGRCYLLFTLNPTSSGGKTVRNCCRRTRS